MIERFIQNKEIVQSKIGEEVVMLDMESGFYFGLNSVASVIWGLLAEGICFDKLIDQLMAQFDVERALCEADTLELLDQMLDKNIIMYCTGGIRCEKASAYFKHQGFKNVYQLEGGIINYAKQIKEENLESKFIGKNFVFDHRLGERITDDICIWVTRLEGFGAEI